MSDSQAEYIGKRTDFKVCKGEKCNSASFHQKCVICDSEEDARCINEPDFNDKTCRNYENRCFTLISTHKVLRGCLEDTNEEIKNKCENENENCDICSKPEHGDACNKIKVNDLNSCVECDSNDDEECRTEPKKFADKICPQFGTSEPKGCYLSIVSYTFQFIIISIYS